LNASAGAAGTPVLPSRGGWGCVMMLLLGGGPEAALAGAEAPLAVANLAPVAQLFGLPRARGATVSDNGQWLLRTEIVNNFTASGQGDQFAAFDGETLVATAGFHRVTAAGWEWGIEVPYVRHRGGFTDRLIDGFHDLSGLPDSGRPEVARHRLDYRYTTAAGERFRIDTETGGVGDVRLQVGRRFLLSAGQGLALRAQLKTATGAEQDLTGSGSTDLAAWVEFADAARLETFGVAVSLAAGVTYLGRSGLVRDDQARVAFSGHLGVQYGLTDRLTLLGQLDGHSRLADTGIDEVGGAALLGTLGGRLQLSQRLALDVAVVEDLTSRSAPDVIFHVALTGRL
jgi:hypothetical protein